MAELGLKDYENLILQSMDQLEQQDVESRTNSIMQKSNEDNKSFLTTFYESLVSKTSEATKSKMPKERVQKIIPDPAVMNEFMAAGENMSAAYQDALMSGLEDTYKMREDQGIIRSLGAGAGLSPVGELPLPKSMEEAITPPTVETKELKDANIKAEDTDDSMSAQEASFNRKGLMAQDYNQPNKMSTKFVRNSITQILKNEGGYQDSTKDKGNYKKADGTILGTMRGITPETYAKFVGKSIDDLTVADMKGISANTARDIYKKEYWEKPKLALLPEELQENVFDMQVNAGKNAVKILQRLAGMTGNAVDGYIGPTTIKKISEANVTNDQYVDARIKYYTKIAKNSKDKDKDGTPDKMAFLDGWKKRAEKYRD